MTLILRLESTIMVVTSILRLWLAQHLVVMLLLIPMEMVILQSMLQLFLAPRGHWFVKSVFDEIKYVVRVFIFGKQDKNRQQVLR